VTVTLSTGRGRPTVGSSIVVQVRIDAASNVASAPFTLLFDPEILEFDPAASTEGTFLNRDGAATSFIARLVSGETDGGVQPDGRAAIAVGLSRLGGSDGISGGGVLCRLVFRARAPGRSALAFTRARILDPGTTVLPSRFEQGSVEVREARR
jgi:hypothetical protein